MPERETTILDYIYVLVKWKKFIILFTVIVSVVAAGITLILPKWYRATATIFIPQSQSTGLSAASGLLSQITSTLPSLPLIGNILGTVAETDQFLAILKSRVAQEYVAKSFNLQKQYKEKNLEETVRTLRKHVGFEETREGGIEITVEDKSSEQASVMANAYIYFLDSLNIQFQTEQARNNRDFIQKRYGQTYKELVAAEDTLRSFQKINKIISLPEQLEAEIQSYAELRGELAMKEIELESLSDFVGKNHPDILLLQSQINSMYKQLSQFEGKSALFETGENNSEYVVPFAETPRIGMEYLRMTREIEIKSILYALLTQQLEQAKIQEARDTPTLQILDEAVPPIKRSKPKRIILTLILGGLAFFLSTGYAFTVEHFSSIQSNSPQEHQKLLAIRKLLSKNKRSDD